MVEEVFNDFDKFLERLVGQYLEGEAGQNIGITPVRILHTVLSRDVVGQLSDPDSDLYHEMDRNVRGRLKGGKKSKRDKHFGIPEDHPFWDWWHRIGKESNAGQDILSKAEADRYFDIYRTHCLHLYVSSRIRRSIRNLNSNKRLFARQSISVLFSYYSGLQ